MLLAYAQKWRWKHIYKKSGIHLDVERKTNRQINNEKIIILEAKRKTLFLLLFLHDLQWRFAIVTFPTSSSEEQFCFFFFHLFLISNVNLSLKKNFSFENLIRMRKNSFAQIFVNFMRIHSFWFCLLYNFFVNSTFCHFHFL